MGVVRFLIAPSELLDNWPEVYRAYLSGFDGRVYPTRVEISGQIMVCRRYCSETARLHVALPLGELGRPVISTTSLAERDEPYLLTLELARGKIAQVRDQLAAWEMLGVQVPDSFSKLHDEAYRIFSRACASQSNTQEAGALALQALRIECEAAQHLAQAYVEQRLAARRRRSAHLPISLGAYLQHENADAACDESAGKCFTAASVPVQWRMVEAEHGEHDWTACDARLAWCEKHRLFASAGPLLDLAPEGLPGWLWRWEHDFSSLQSLASDFVETAITRYLGRIRSWELVARPNTGGALTLNEEQRLRLVARLIEVARHVDHELQLSIRIDQPWGDYQARGHHRLSPLQFVDALVRAGIGLSTINLEIAIGYRPRGSAPRDALDLSRLIDQWSQLGLPLHATLAFPSSPAEDPQARPDLEIDALPRGPGWTEDAQAKWVARYVPMLMSKESVTGIYWPHVTDAAPHEFPHAGLLRADGTAKPALERIVECCCWPAAG